jgi:hypothetical protein
MTIAGMGHVELLRAYRIRAKYDKRVTKREIALAKEILLRMITVGQEGRKDRTLRDIVIEKIKQIYNDN